MPGAGEGIRDGLTRMLNDNTEKAKLLAFQMELLKNHLENGLVETIPTMS